MEINELLSLGKGIWGDEELDLKDIIVRLSVVLGDICRWERNAKKDSKNHTKPELEKEFGNLIFNSILWASRLGFDPEKCIAAAVEAQRKNVFELLPK